MKSLKEIALWFVVVIVMMITAACHHNSDVYDITPEEEVQHQPYLTLRLSFGGHSSMATRASGNPTGGEIGDGLEAGLHHENDINNLCLFKYNAGAKGINGDASTPVVKLAYITNINFKPESNPFNIDTITKDIPLEDVDYDYTANDHFIVVVNAGNICGQETTLGALRDHLMDMPYEESIGYKCNYDNFTMANADDSHYTAGDGTKANPRTIHVNLERTAARIDFAIDGSTVENDKRAYNVLGTSGSRVLLSHVKAFNLMQEPTYLIKRLAESSTATPSFLENEANPAVKYIVEPHTWLKNSSGKTEERLYSWYGNTRQPKTVAEAQTWFTDRDKVHVGSGNAFTDGVTYDNLFNNTFYVVSYTNENTASIEDTDGKVTTGIKLKATFVPGKLYKYNEDSELVLVDNYTAGTTFYRYQPVTNSNNYNDANNVYFVSLDDANTYKNAHPEELATVTEYTNGICYYTAWLRHDRQYNTNNETIGKNMMEFGIVRNNIYRLKVEFSGPGSNIPNTSEDPENIRTYIYVKKWNYIEHPPIEI